MTPEEFIKTATYKKGSVLDGIRYVPDGVSVDCDDFAWTMLCMIEGGKRKAIKALASGKAELWRVHSPQNKAIARHVALWHRDYGWIDSTRRKWRETPAPHVKVRKMRLFTVLPLIAWGYPLGKIAGAGLVVLLVSNLGHIVKFL